jgi:hypothetical protein
MKSLSYQQATRETAESLQKVASSLEVQKLTQLSLPEIEAVAELVGKVIPAGNVPGMILSGLTRLAGNQVQPQKARQDINILFREVSLFFEQAKYGTMFAGPAAIIWGYQNLLRLAGKDAESAFPEGVWQFYVDYALREDTARHTNETHGFDTRLAENNIHLSQVDRLTAWVMAAVTCLHQYDQLLASEWYERTALWWLQELNGGTDLYSVWEKQKIYGRDSGGAAYDYPAYRRLKFDQFLQSHINVLPRATRPAWEAKLTEASERGLAAYQKQLSILAYLSPSAYGETRVPLPLEQACIGIILNGNYYLLPACEPGTSKPLDVRTARSQIASLLDLSPAGTPTTLTDLARLKRTELLNLRKRFNPALQTSLEKLRFAPILINSDPPPSVTLLSEIRQGERGVGDHALTIFDTGETFVFDQSHIFFDGAWGAALAEIMTNEALSWAAYLNLLSSAMPANSRICTPLQLSLSQAELQAVQRASRVSPEAGAENSQIDIKACLDLKHYFKQRNDLLKLTINDLLVLYRAIHAATYQPSKQLRLTLDEFTRHNLEAGKRVWQVLQNSASTNPSILIPIDASKRLPRDRVYPMNMEVPLAELDLLNLHSETTRALALYVSAQKFDPVRYSRFEQLQRRYLATLGGFGTILTKARDIAVKGESASVGAIKLLAHIPLPIKQLLDKVPARYEKLNNLLKGTEVISNLGAVAKTSSVTRFITAKDDNDQKQLTWGVLTDARGVMRITLRDFRPHVAVLHEAGRMDLANQIAQEFLDAYVQGFNQFIREVTQIAVARPLDSHRRAMINP